jgi:hypothetical protein
MLDVVSNPRQAGFGKTEFFSAERDAGYAGGLQNRADSRNMGRE